MVIILQKSCVYLNEIVLSSSLENILSNLWWTCVPFDVKNRTATIIEQPSQKGKKGEL